MKKALVIIFTGFLLVNIYGCFALLVGAGAGAGTAAWLSGKLTQEVHAPFDRAIKASESALDSLKLPVTKKTVENNVAQIKSEYTDGKTIWIDIHRVTDTSSKIEIRVGAVGGDKEAATDILNRINRYL
ncbi:MAG: DUF3568 family protein [Deltaproteobacteria bacterium]